MLQCIWKDDVGQKYAAGNDQDNDVEEQGKYAER